MKVYGTCTDCEFEVSAATLDDLDSKFKQHFITSGHDAYFYTDMKVQKIRKIV